MRKRDFASLICKGLGIYPLISSLNSLPALWLSILPVQHLTSTPLDPRIYYILSAIPGVLTFFVAVILWTQSDRISEIMAPDESQVGTVENVEATHDFGPLAFSCIGLLTLLQTLPRLCLMLLLLTLQYPLTQSDGQDIGFSQFIISVIELFLGLWLLLGIRDPHGLARWLQKPGAKFVDVRKNASDEASDG